MAWGWDRIGRLALLGWCSLFGVRLLLFLFLLLFFFYKLDPSSFPDQKWEIFLFYFWHSSFFWGYPTTYLAPSIIIEKVYQKVISFTL